MPSGQHRKFLVNICLLIVLRVYLVQTLKTYLRILKRLCKTNKLTYWCRHLPDDVCERHHHSKSHRTLHNRFCGYVVDKYVSRLCEKHRARLLYLTYTQTFQSNLEKFDLYTFPFPAFLPLAVVELNVLHALNQLYHLALLLCRLVKTLDVQFPAIAHEERDPDHIQCVAYNEYRHHQYIVICKDGKENHKVDKREHYAHAVREQKILYAPVVTNALQYVAGHARVEELQRHCCQLYKEVGYKLDINARVHVEHYP